jgi:hypothetical protein
MTSRFLNPEMLILAYTTSGQMQCNNGPSKSWEGTLTRLQMLVGLQSADYEAVDIVSALTETQYRHISWCRCRK